MDRHPNVQSEVWLHSMVMTSWESPDPVQGSPGQRSTSSLDDLFDEPHPRSVAGDKHPGRLHERVSWSGLAPARLLPNNTGHGLSNSSFDYPAGNQESNPSLDTITPYLQWGFPTSNHLLNDLVLPPLLSTPGDKDPAGLTGLIPQNYFSSATRNGGSDDSQFGAQLIDET